MTAALETLELSQRYGRILSASLPCELDVFDFLLHAQGETRFLWSEPNSERLVAGFGTAVELSSWGESRFTDIAVQAKSLLENSTSQSPKLFGGFAFQSDFVPENAWANFAPAQFILPHYQLDITTEGSFLSVHVELQNDELSQAELEEVLRARYDLIKQEANKRQLQKTHKPNALSSLSDLSSLEDWTQMIHSAQAFMNTGELSKVVLARVKEASFEETISPLQALRYLDAVYPDCYRFLFEPKAGDAFIGATPELLVGLEEDKALSMALAASAARGDTQAEDDALAQALLADPKENREHKLVKDKLAERLRAFGNVESAETGVLKLSNIQHIYTAVQVELKQDAKTQSVLEFLEALHPTPALGGEPFHLASQLITELEYLPRGWYGAPIGFIDTDLRGSFAVAIRSAVIQQNRAWLFSGAGIMPRSIPEKEWQETAMKFRPMLNALGIDLKGKNVKVEADASA